jgi:hypothetical protein
LQPNKIYSKIKLLNKFTQLAKYGILTSEEIQENFLQATKRRKCVKIKKDYLLINTEFLPANVIILD